MATLQKYTHKKVTKKTKKKKRKKAKKGRGERRESVVDLDLEGHLHPGCSAGSRERTGQERFSRIILTPRSQTEEDA